MPSEPPERFDASTSNQQSSAAKRKSSSKTYSNEKYFRYSSLIVLFKDIEFSDKSVDKFKRLVGIEDVNTYDEVEKCTPLRYCVAEQKNCWIPWLLEYGADSTLTAIEMDDKIIETASDVALSKNEYGVLEQLITADGPFPCGFNIEKLERLPSNTIKLHNKKLGKFHEQIKLRKITEVVKFVENHPNIRYAYSINNQSALTAALEAKTFEVYSFLRSKGFSSGIDASQHDKIITKLDAFDKNLLDIEIRKYFQSANFHVLRLLSKSRLGMNNEEKYFENIKNCFEALDEIESIRPILIIVANDPKVTISFDFNQDSVCDLDPRCFATPENITGRTNEKTGHILIAAKRDHAEIMGTLAHELTHYALQLVYSNKYLPYGSSDDHEQKKRDFDKVVETCYKLRSKHATIDDAYNYKEPKISSELIVRVPQMLALFKDKPELVKFQKTYKELFNFYEKSVLPDLNTEVDLIEPKRKAQELNELSGLLECLSRSKIRCKIGTSVLNEIVNESKHTFVETKTPEVTMASLIGNMNNENTRENKKVGSRNIFLRLKQLFECHHSENLEFIFKSKLKPTIYILDSEEIDIKNCKITFDQMDNESKIVFITKRNYKNFKEYFPKIHDTSFEWNDLTEDAKTEILESKYAFQNSEVFFRQIVSKDSEILLSMALEDILCIKHTKSEVLEEFLPALSNVYIERCFEAISNRKKSFLRSENIIDSLKNERCIILADTAGMGKTTSAIHFARTLKLSRTLNDPLLWIVFVDLKQHTTVYTRDGQQQLIKVDFKLFSHHLMKLKSEFEQKLFEDFFKNKNVVFVIDGIDEISPSYKKYVLKFTKFIKVSGNGLLVTTRTHLAGELEKELAKTAIKLKPFSEGDQIEFLMKFWRQSSPETPDDELEKKAQELLKKFQKTLNRRDFVEVPLQLYMLAEVYEKSKTLVLDQLNLFSLYKSFVDKKVNIWNKKGPLAQEDNTKLQTGTLTVCQMHQKIAIKYIFGNTIAEVLGLLDIGDDFELITRIGLIRIAPNDEFEFVHKTFAEHMIADYCFTKITESALISSVEMFIKVFIESDYDNIRKFLNDKLQTEQSKLENGILLLQFSAELVEKKNHFFLGQLVAEKLVNLAKLVLHTKTIDNQTKFQLVQYQNKYYGNSLHIAMENIKLFKNLWDSIESFADDNEQKQLLTVDFDGKGNILDRAIENKNEAISIFVLDVLQKVMSKEEYIAMVSPNDSEVDSILVKSAKAEDFSTFKIYWKSIEKKLDVKDQKTLLYLDCEGVLKYLRFMPKGIRVVLETLKDLLKPSELRYFLLNDDWLVDVLCYFAFCAKFEGLYTIWKFIENNFERAEQKTLFLKKFLGNRNALVSSCVNKNTQTMNLAFTIARDLLTIEEFREQLTTVDNIGYFAFHHALFTGNVLNYIEAFEQEFNVTCEIHDLLVLEFPEQSNVMHVLCSNFSDSKDPWKFICDHLDRVEIEAFLLAKDVNGCNAFASAAVFRSSILITFLEWMTSISSNKLKTIFEERSNNLNTLMHSLAWYCDENLTQQCLLFATKNFEKHEIREMILAEDKDGDTPLFDSLFNSHSSTVRVFWKVYEKYLDSDELKTLLLKDDKSFLQYNGSKKVESIDLLKALVFEKFGNLQDTVQDTVQDNDEVEIPEPDAPEGEKSEYFIVNRQVKVEMRKRSNSI